MNPDCFVKGKGVYGVDSTHMKYRRYNGIKTFLVVRDENISNQVTGVALAPVEDFDNYAWFFSL